MMQRHVAMSEVLPELIIVQTRVLRSCDWRENTKKRKLWQRPFSAVLSTQYSKGKWSVDQRLSIGSYAGKVLVQVYQVSSPCVVSLVSLRSEEVILKKIA